MGFGLGGGCSSSSSSSFCLQHPLPPFTRIRIATNTNSSGSWRSYRKRCSSIQSLSVSYHKFVDFALDETKCHTHLLPSPLQVFFFFFHFGLRFVSIFWYMGSLVLKWFIRVSSILFYSFGNSLYWVMTCVLNNE